LLAAVGEKLFKNIDSKTVYKRMEALDQEGWIAKEGTRTGKIDGKDHIFTS
jgi:hypothetical protein